MLNVCDLSTDGCYTMGAAAGAVVALAGHPFLALFAAMAAGVLSGLVNAFLQTKMKVESMLAGLIVNTGLYTVNICIMGKSNLNMNTTTTVFSMMKDLLKGTALESYSKMISQAVDRVRQIREAAGDDMDLCLELHRRMKPSEAIDFAQKVAKYTPMFLEDPIIPDNFDDMAWIADHSTVPIATGERIHTIQEFQMLLQRHAMGYARTSVCLCGGITGARKIAHIAEAHGALIVPHNPLSPVSTAACMQVAATVENFAIQELPDHSGISATERYTSTNKMDQHSFRQSDMVTWVPTVENGFALLPTAPGIGVDLVDDAEIKFPFKRRTINTRLHIDGSIVDQ